MKLDRMKSAFHYAAALLRNRQGLAAIEFAMILPVMLVMFFGCIEVTNLLLAERRIQSVAATLADLVARDDNITTAEMDDIFAASTAVMAGFSGPALQMVVTSINDNSGTSKVAWSRAKNAAADAAGGTVSNLPNGLMLTDGSVIRVQVIFPYNLVTMGTSNYQQSSDGKTIMNYDIGSAHTISKTFYMRPRLVMQIPAPS